MSLFKSHYSTQMYQRTRFLHTILLAYPLHSEHLAFHATFPVRVIFLVYSDYGSATFFNVTLLSPFLCCNNNLICMM